MTHVVHDVSYTVQADARLVLTVVFGVCVAGCCDNGVGVMEVSLCLHI